MYEARLKYLRDQLSNIMGERRAGREEGIKEGIQKEREAVIRKMLSSGTAPDTIANMLDYSLEEIKKIQREIESDR